MTPDKNLFPQEAKPDNIPTREEEKQNIVLWISIILVVIIIFVAWLFFIRKNFQNIDQRLKIESATTTEEANQQFQDTLKDLGQMIELAGDEIEAIKQKQAEQKKQAQDLEIAADKMADELEQQNLATDEIELNNKQE